MKCFGYIVYGYDDLFIIFIMFYYFVKIVVFSYEMFKCKILVVVVGYFVIFFISFCVCFCVFLVYNKEDLDCVFVVCDEVGDII